MNYPKRIITGKIEFVDYASFRPRAIVHRVKEYFEASNLEEYLDIMSSLQRKCYGCEVLVLGEYNREVVWRNEEEGKKFGEK